MIKIGIILEFDSIMIRKEFHFKPKLHDPVLIIRL